MFLSGFSGLMYCRSVLPIHELAFILGRNDGPELERGCAGYGPGRRVLQGVARSHPDVARIVGGDRSPRQMFSVGG